MLEARHGGLSLGQVIDGGSWSYQHILISQRGNRGTGKCHHFLGGSGAESTKQIICCQAGLLQNMTPAPLPSSSGHEGPSPPLPSPAFGT